MLLKDSSLLNFFLTQIKIILPPLPFPPSFFLLCQVAILTVLLLLSLLLLTTLLYFYLFLSASHTTLPTSVASPLFTFSNALSTSFILTFIILFSLITFLPNIFQASALSFSFFKKHQNTPPSFKILLFCQYIPIFIFKFNL